MVSVANNEGTGFVPKILSLDSSGPRAITALYILKNVMEQIQQIEKRPELPLPCEYFDLIGGVGNGGIIALMLGKLGMTVDECITAYKELDPDHLRWISKSIGAHIPSQWVGCGERARGGVLDKIVKDLCDEQNKLPEKKKFTDTVVIVRSSDIEPQLTRSPRKHKPFVYTLFTWKAASETSTGKPFGEWTDGDAPRIENVRGECQRPSLCEDLYEEAKNKFFPQCQTMKILSIGPAVWDWYPAEEWRIDCMDEKRKEAKFDASAFTDPKVEYCRLYGHADVREEESYSWKDQENTEMSQAETYMGEEETRKEIEKFLTGPRGTEEEEKEDIM